MDIILCSLLKKQNQILLESICEKYQLEKERIMKMYHTPTFYQLDIVPSPYKVVCVDKKKQKKLEKDSFLELK